MQEYPEKISDKQVRGAIGEAGSGTIPNRCEQFPFVNVREGQLVYDFGRCLDFMGQKGRELYGDHFRIWEEDQELIYRLLIYVIRDQAEAVRLGLDLGKGLMVTGPVGCGKTSLMSLLRYFQPQAGRFIVRSCREVSFEFIRNGFEVIRKYSTLSYDPHSPGGAIPRTFCFDDLGTEQSLKYYGNECNVMGEILLSRYDQFASGGMLTHLTTNLSAPEIGGLYGERVRSRLREMVNVVAFGKDAKDKRR